MAALRYCARSGQHVLSVVNVPESTMARESDAVLQTVAGPEIGVATTKAFTAQLAVLACLALGRRPGARQLIDAGRGGGADPGAAGSAGPRRARCWSRTPRSSALAAEVAKARDVLFLGRGSCFPIALEGALKLKEISYIHAEGYAAGEMKHGPIALIDDVGAGDRPRALRAAVREDRVQPAGGGGARRAGHRASPTRQGRRKLRGIADRVDRAAARSTPFVRRSCTPSRCSCWPTTSPC